MADSTTPVMQATAGTLDQIDESSGTVGATTVKRQRIVVASAFGTDAGAKTTTAGPAAGVEGMVVYQGNLARTRVTLYADAAAGVTTEALLTLSSTSGGAAGTAGTSYTVPAGKTLRIQSIVASYVATVASLSTMKLHLRRASASFTVASPIELSIPRLGFDVSTVAIGQATDQTMITFADGLEFPAGDIIGVSQIASAASGTVDVTLNGYTY